MSTLHLDSASLAADELSIPTLMRELNLQNRPPWILRSLMNALERQRQTRGLGWSRPWNKIGMNVFRTHRHDLEVDTGYFEAMQPVLASLLPQAPAEFAAFAGDLLRDPGRLAFTFYHNREENGAQYEGLTLSIGRKVRDDPSKRDRLDVILEDLRVAGAVDGRVDRLRLCLCPWSAYRHDRYHIVLDRPTLSDDERERAQTLYSTAVAAYHSWKADEARQWSHWSANYIDYFGPRAFIPVGTSFS